MTIVSFFKRISTIRIYWRRKQLWRLLCFFPFPVTVQTRQGIFKLHPSPNDIVSRELYINRAFELDMATEAVKLCRKLNNIPPGQGRIIDIGANNGVISIGLLSSGELQEAICIEPDPQNFHRLEQNCHLNQLENRIVRHNLALSDRTAQLEFEISHLDKGDHRVRMQSLTNLENNEESLRSTIEVKGMKLDDLLSSSDLKEKALIWMDTQGHEGYIFKGAQQLLQEKIPVVCEVCPYLTLRAGMQLETYINIVSQLFDHVWVQEDMTFIKHPVQYISEVMDSLGNEGPFTDVVYH